MNESVICSEASILVITRYNSNHYKNISDNRRYTIHLFGYSFQTTNISPNLLISRGLLYYKSVLFQMVYHPLHHQTVFCRISLI